MSEVRDALLRMVKAHRMIGEILKAYVKVGLDSNELFDAQGEVSEAIYKLIGEHAEEFVKSSTYIIISAPYLNDERRTELLYSIWKNNHPDQPKPNTMSQEEFMRYFKENGGYSRPLAEGEGP